MSGIHHTFHLHKMMGAKVKMYRAFVGMGMKVHLVVKFDNDWIFTACGQRTRYHPDVRPTKVRITCKKCAKVIS